MNVILGILTVVLVVVSFFLILIVLMQKAQSDAGMGAVMGGSMTEATFGAETTNVLTRWTIYFAVAFFVLSIALFLGRIYQHDHAGRGTGLLPTMPAPMPAFPPPALPTLPAPATPKPAPSGAIPSAAPSGASSGAAQH